MKLIRFGEPGKEKPGAILKESAASMRPPWVPIMMRGFLRAAGWPSSIPGCSRRLICPAGSAVCTSGIGGMPAQQDRLHRPQLPRPCGGDESGTSERAGSLL